MITVGIFLAALMALHLWHRSPTIIKWLGMASLCVDVIGNVRVIEALPVPVGQAIFATVFALFIAGLAIDENNKPERAMVRISFPGCRRICKLVAANINSSGAIHGSATIASNGTMIIAPVIVSKKGTKPKRAKVAIASKSVSTPFWNSFIAIASSSLNSLFSPRQATVGDVAMGEGDNTKGHNMDQIERFTETRKSRQA
ncbi:unknown protein [Seminavis robusta]|uniref:Uncharacterized protein n=1 Tax=Seminavis robusta TaxID=568900 RepID=A0A9N8F2B0_9STRA|nr:unknown protein [Seminavis robusta]|eukprot:Sro3475_g348430.1 n/a (200) ;mRNA; f:3532-4131